MRKDRPVLEPSELEIRIKEMPDIYSEAIVDLLEQLREQAFGFATAPEASKDSHYTAHCNGGAYWVDVAIEGLLEIRKKN